MRYKQYELDRFQEEAIKSIEQDHSVIVAAPTGAGKTLIAEYAVEKHIEAGKQIIYTAPIKALSNQKYRDFSHDYGDKVGIVTGDVVLNATAPTLIMTTEIFRNTIFNSPESLKDVRYVIFDEIHFIDDITRGTVWEESIIFAPQHIKFICLSATIPNLEEFAEWMRSVRDGAIDVISETERPVPLEHKLYMKEYGLGWLDEFKEVKEAATLTRGTRQDQPRGLRDFGLGNWQPGAAGTQVMAPTIPDSVEELAGEDLIEHIQASEQLPCLYFSFSRSGCEEKALENINREFLSPEETETILNEYDQLCERYGLQEDKRAEEFRKFVEQGVAYHHAGMLPTLKEVVERLFTLGYIKLLFTTETFALGINMPACTVVLDSLAKFDGVDFRPLKSREYHQMAGRAGRRGIDTQGFVYACIDPQFSEYEDVESVVSGEIEDIESQFNLFYSVILNLYDRHGERIYEVCKKSLNTHQNARVLKQLDESVKRAKERQAEEKEKLVCVRGGDVKDLQDYITLERELKAEQRAGRTQGRRGRRGMIRQNTRPMVMKTMKCHGCGNLRKCARIANEVKDYDELISELSDNKKLMEDYQRQQIESRIALLREMGYIDNGDLTPKGKAASQIYGYSLQITELLFDEYFHRLDPDLVNILMMATVFEAKPNCWYEEVDEEMTASILAEPSRKVESIRAREETLGIDSPLKELDASLSAATYAWSGGCEFDELWDYTDATPGDLVRYFRLASDLLRQTRRAVSDDDDLLNKINECIARMNRDVVDAERQLRAG
ncbi:DEAD/DEAH box helicase [Candidatus Poribacteria bacterium]